MTPAPNQQQAVGEPTWDLPVLRLGSGAPPVEREESAKDRLPINLGHGDDR